MLPISFWEVGNGTTTQAPYDALSNVKYAQIRNDDAERDEFYHYSTDLAVHWEW